MGGLAGKPDLLLEGQAIASVSLFHPYSAIFVYKHAWTVCIYLSVWSSEIKKKQWRILVLLWIYNHVFSESDKLRATIWILVALLIRDKTWKHWWIPVSILRLLDCSFMGTTDWFGLFRATQVTQVISGRSLDTSGEYSQILTAIYFYYSLKSH